MSIIIIEDFVGYPGGKKRAFKVGEEPADLDASYAALLVKKGHAREKAEPKGKAK